MLKTEKLTTDNSEHKTEDVYNYKYTNNNAVTQDVSVDFCRELLSYLPSRPDYEMWYQIIAAVGNTFDEKTALDLLTSRYPDEKPNETLYKLQRRSKQDFGFIVNRAKENGWTGKVNSNSFHNYTPKKAPDEPQIDFTDVDTDSLKYVGDVRLYRIAVNRAVKDKTTDYVSFTECWTNETLTLSEIDFEIRQGHAICGAQMKQESDGTIKRQSDNFMQSEMIIIDLDYATKDKQRDDENYLSVLDFLETDLAEDCALVYTTATSTDDWNRYRLLIPLPYLETNAKRYRRILEGFIRSFKSDKSCSDICRGYYGNTNAKIFNLITGEINA